jgi:hypothetical protein
MQPEVVWAGRGELTEWPAVDWALIMRDESWQPIWPIQPMTNALMWTRRMGSRRYHDNGWTGVSSGPALVDLERLRRMEDAWAKIARLQSESVFAPSVDAPAVDSVKITEPVAAAATTEAAIAEIQQVEDTMAAAGCAWPVALCATTNKVRHRSKLWALVHRNRLANLPDEHFPERLESYKCKWCGSWHVGHRA